MAFKMNGFSGFKKDEKPFEPAFEGADMSRQEYEKKLKMFMKNGFNKEEATKFIGDGVSLAEAKKKTKEFNFSKLRRKPTIVDTEESGRYMNPG